MNRILNKNTFLNKYPYIAKDVNDYDINWNNLSNIYSDFYTLRNNYENQADFIANILRTHCKIHTVKARCKNPERLIEKIIRKTPDRKEKYGEGFQFNVNNYKEEINDLIGIRAIHLFKDDWEDIHQFILNTWKVIEITANIRDGDDTKCFEELDIKIQSRKSGYRSVHYLIEFYPTNQKVIAEIQVRTIFEEAYGEIDHQLRYSHQEIPKLLESNLLLFNRLSGSADEMASLINLLNKNLISIEDCYENMIKEKNEEIHLLNEEIFILKEKLKEQGL